jgi:hypothetical protein
VVEHLLARRGAKGLSREDAERLARDPLYFADSLVALGDADGCGLFWDFLSIHQKRNAEYGRTDDEAAAFRRGLDVMTFLYASLKHHRSTSDGSAAAAPAVRRAAHRVECV